MHCERDWGGGKLDQGVHGGVEFRGNGKKENLFFWYGGGESKTKGSCGAEGIMNARKVVFVRIGNRKKQVRVRGGNRKGEI